MTTTNTHPGRYWHLTEEGKVQCDLCPRFCVLGKGQRGLCFVRGEENQQIVLHTYGRSSGFCIDPIEKKPLNHFYPGIPIFSFGTAGCNLTCKFCQNWDISKSKEMDKLQSKASPSDIVAMAKSKQVSALAYTYNDPVIFFEYAIDTARLARENGMLNVAVTAGYICKEPRSEFFKYMDATNIDLKSFNQKFYKEITGSSLESVLETIKYVKEETNTWMEITTLLIPDHNDSPKEIEDLCSWIIDNLGKDVPLHFSAFRPHYKMLNVESTPPKTLYRARQQAIELGLNYVYTGNIHDSKTSSTYCPSCKKLIIERDVYEVRSFHIKNGQCNYCHCPIAGHFQDSAGHFGNKRIPLG